MPAGNVYHSGHLVPSFLGHAYARILGTFSKYFLVMFLTFILRVPLGYFAIWLQRWRCESLVYVGYNT